MSEKIEFRENPYEINMDRLWIDNSYVSSNIPRWAFEDLPDDKKEVVYQALRDMYKTGFRRGRDDKSFEINKLIDGLKQCLS